MRVLVTGAGGLLGGAIAREFSGAADVHLRTRAALDIADDHASSEAVAAIRPDVVINCAAFNDVDGAEGNPVPALEVNAFGVRSLALATRAAGAALMHFSTDFVFDGTATRPYTEEDAPNPQGVYAVSKLLGEWFALDHPRAYVLRVESLFGRSTNGGATRSSLGRILDAIGRGDEVPIFVDRTVSPSYIDDVSAAARALIVRAAPPGLYHCVNSGAASWAEVAGEAARLLGRPLHMKPITLETAGLAARRPRYCAMSNAKLAGAGIQMPAWQDALARHVRAAY